MDKVLDRGLTSWVLTMIAALGMCSIGACSVDDLIVAGRPCSANEPCGPGLSCSSGICTSRPADAALPDRGAPMDTLTVDRPPAGEQIRADLAAPDAFVVPGTWVKLPAGSFLMGSPANEPCHQSLSSTSLKDTQHSVTLTHPFEIMTNEVSEGQFEQIMGYNASNPRTGSIWPYNSATWHEAALFCNRLSDLSGLPRCYATSGSAKLCNLALVCPLFEICVSSVCKRLAPAAGYAGGKIYGCPGYRLPTEAEWEYAYRAGISDAYYNGEGVAAVSCGTCTTVDPTVDKIGWYCANSPSKTQPLTKTKLPNAWGLYNMAGSLAEWCHDAAKVELGSGAVIDPVAGHDPVQETYGVVRGGSYYHRKEALRAAWRRLKAMYLRDNVVGFRCVRSLSPAKADAGP